MKRMTFALAVACVVVVSGEAFAAEPADDVWLDFGGGFEQKVSKFFAAEVSKETGRRVRVVPSPSDEDGWKSLRRSVKGAIWCPDAEACAAWTNAVAELHARFDSMRIALRQPELRLYFSEVLSSAGPGAAGWNDALTRFDMEEPKAEMVPVDDLVGKESEQVAVALAKRLAAWALHNEYGRRDVAVLRARPLPVIPAGTFDPIAWVERKIAAGEQTVVVPAGQYDVDRKDGRYLVLKDLKDATIDFSGSFLRLRTHGMPFQLVNCRNVTIRNLTIDFPWTLPFSQGIIEEIGPQGEWDIRVANGYCEKPACGWPVQAYDRKTGLLTNPMVSDRALKVEALGAGRIRISGGKRRAEKVGDVAVWRCAKNNGYGPMNVGCGACTFENITWYTMPADRGLREIGGPGGNVYRRCRLVPCPQLDDPVVREIPRFRSGSHEGFNSRGMGRGPVCDFCETEYHTDDDVNINGGYWVVLEAEGTKVRATCSELYLDTFACGPVQLMMPDGTVPVDTPDVIAFRKKGKPTEEELKRVIDAGLDWHVADKLTVTFEFTLAKADGRFCPGTVFVPQNAAGNGYRFSNCVFGRTRARGIILNASYGTVENCLFDMMRAEGIRSSASYPWLEGGCSRGVTVRDCTFNGVDCHFGAKLPNKRKLTAEGHRDIVACDNVFRGESRLSVEGCTGLTTEGNTFDVGEKRGVKLLNVRPTCVRR